MKKYAGFSLIEALILLMVSALLILASFPVLTKKSIFQGKNNSVIECIQKENAADLTSTACTATIKGSLYNRSNYLDTLMMFVDDTTYSSLGLKVLKEVCDEGSKTACNKIIDMCSKDNKCNLGESNDISFYLKLLSDNSNLSMAYMRDTIAGYYNIGISNIRAIVDSICCNPGLNMACIIKGVTSCNINPWQDEVNKGTDTGNNITIDNSGNVYILVTTDNASSGNNISITKLNSRGGKVWDLGVSGIDQSGQITFGADGYIYAVGTVTVSATDSDIAVIKVDPDNGKLIWAKKYGDNQYVKDIGMGLTTDANYVYVIGYSLTRDPRNDLRLLKIKNSTGEISVKDTTTLFRQFVTASPDSPDYSDHRGTVITMVNGSLYFAETYEPSSCPDDIRVLIGKASAVDLSVGTTSVITSGGLSNITITGMTTGKAINGGVSTTNLYVTAYNAASPNGLLVIYDTNSNDITHIYKYDTAIRFNHVAAVDNSGQVYLVGKSGSSIAIICVNISDGTVVWKRLINTSTSSLNLDGKGIVITPVAPYNQYSYIVASCTNNDAFALKLPLTLNDDTSFSFPDGVIHALSNVSTGSGLMTVDPASPASFTQTNAGSSFAVNYAVSSPSPALVYN